MALPFYNWSRTAASNSNADATVNWAEGQAPSSVNDSARAMMASTAAFRDDISGAIVTAGTSTAYTVASYQVFDTLAHMNGQLIAFSPHATNGATVTLNVDGLGAKPLRSAPSTELLAGTLILGTPYIAVYNSSDSAFYLHGFYGNPYNVPLLGGMDYWDTIAPNSSFIFPAGQALSRTTYAATFARWGTTYGSGDGSTTFNAPDKTGRVSAMKESAATRLTTAVSGVDGSTMGSASTAQTSTIGQGNLPAVNLAITDSRTYQFGVENVGNAATTGVGQYVRQVNNTPGPSNTIAITPSGTITAALGGSGTGLPVVQPTIICQYIIRVL